MWLYEQCAIAICLTLVLYQITSSPIRILDNLTEVKQAQNRRVKAIFAPCYRERWEGNLLPLRGDLYRNFFFFFFLL